MRCGSQLLAWGTLLIGSFPLASAVANTSLTALKI
jgi:hypothetical protein